MKIVNLLQYTSIICIPMLIRLAVKRYFKRKIAEIDQKEDPFFYTQIFITVENVKCLTHIYRKRSCGKSCSLNHLRKLEEYILSARHTISICMYLLTCVELKFALLQAFGRGVNVRCIADPVMAGNNSSQYPYLSKCGIPVKIPNCENSLMHHKFCLIDEYKPNGRIMFGSTNFTCQALSANWDQIIFTNNADMVKAFAKEFEYLWDNFTLLE